MGLLGETIQNVNTYLTNFATGYAMRNPVADFVAPPFQVKYEAGRYVEYTKSVFRIFDDKISGRERAKEIQWDVDCGTYACEEYSMEKFVSDKAKAQAVEPIRLDEDATKFLKRFHAQAREYRINQIAGNTALIPNINIAAAWAGAAGTPVADILLGMSTIDIACGFIPNRILIPNQVALRMIQTTEWRTYFTFTSEGFNSGLFDAVAGLRKLGLEPMLTNSVGLSTAKCTASDPTSESLWSDSVLLFYCEPVPTTESRTFMYSPFVAQNQVFTTREPRERGVYHTIYSDIDELLVDSSCGYLMTNTL